MKLDVGNWKYVLLKDICKITMGNKMDASAMTSNNPEVNFVGRSADNNGVAGKVDIVYDNEGKMIKPYPAGCVTVALGGSLGSTFLQKEPFYTSQNVSVLEFPEGVSDEAKLFLCTLIYNESKYKYFPFGRELNTHIRVDYGFTIPVLPDGTPNWCFMDDYIKSLHHKPLTTKNEPGKAFDLNVQNWGEFRVGDLFNVEGSTSTSVEELEDAGRGAFPYVTTSASDNGVSGFYAKSTERGNIICIESACAAYATYQPDDFSASDHIEKCIPKFEINVYLAMFLVSVLNLDQYKYSYGRKCNQIRIRDRIIKLPITPGGQPDWQFMEEYIKALPYGDRL